MKVDERTVTSSIDFAVGKELRPHDKESDKDLILDYQLETFENLVQLAHEEGLSGDVANAIFFIAGRLSQARKISSLQNNEGKLRDYSAAARNTLRNNHLDYIVQYPELEPVNP